MKKKIVYIGAVIVIFILACSVLFNFNRKSKKEEKLTDKKSYLLCEGNTSKPYLLKSLTNYNFFVCDVDNKDYFWLDEICI